MNNHTMHYDNTPVDKNTDSGSNIKLIIAGACGVIILICIIIKMICCYNKGKGKNSEKTIRTISYEKNGLV